MAYLHILFFQTEAWARKQQPALVNMLKYERRQITLNLLEQLKLVTTILYFISCRTGYTIEFVSARYEIDV